MLAGDLSRNRLPAFLSKAQSPDALLTALPPELPDLLLDTGAGKRGSMNFAHLPGGSSPRADYAGPSGASPGALLSSPRPEWGSEGAGPNGSAPDSATPPDHADDLAADSPTGFAAENVGGLPGDAGVGGRDCLLFRFLPRWRDHCTHHLRFRCRYAPLVGRRRD